MLDAPREEALEWLAEHRPLYLPHAPDVVARVSGVRFSYGDRVVLESASLEVRRGEIVALVGPNGVGKTTLAQIAAGLARTGVGEVTQQRSRVPRRRIPAVISSPSACSTRSRSARTRRAPGPRSQSSGLRRLRRAASTRPVRRRARTAVARCGARDRARTSWCSTSRRAASTRSARSSSRGCCGPRRPLRGTLVVTHDLPWAAEVADRVVELDVREGVRA